MWKKIIEILGNPILFYADKQGNAVFRNYCILKNSGCLYKLQLSKIEVGKILEYRFELDKKLRMAYILVPLFIYIMFIHMKFSLWNLLWCEFLWLALVFSARMLCSFFYCRHLEENFGKYELVNFTPHLPVHKHEEFRSNFYSRLIIIGIVLALFFSPAFLLYYAMKLSVSGKKPHFESAIKLSKIYTALYPKTEGVYDMRAYAKYMKHDYEGSLADYKTVLELSGSKFGKKDLARLANLLYLEKKLNTPEDAVVSFNDYVTRKKMSVLEQSQMLWIKSIFSIENNMPETIIQDYDDLLTSLDSNDKRNHFYITCDKAYILYLMRQFEFAMEVYNIAIAYAEADRKNFSKELKTLYVERGYTRKQLGDYMGAESDFLNSGIDIFELDKYEPRYSDQEFMIP